MEGTLSVDSLSVLMDWTLRVGGDSMADEASRKTTPPLGSCTAASAFLERAWIRYQTARTPQFHYAINQCRTKGGVECFAVRE